MNFVKGHKKFSQTVFMSPFAQKFTLSYAYITWKQKPLKKSEQFKIMPYCFFL